MRRRNITAAIRIMPAVNLFAAVIIAIAIVSVTVMLCASHALAQQGSQKDNAGQVIAVFDDSVSNSAIKKIIKRNDGETEDITRISDRKIALANAETSQASLIDDLDSERRVVLVQPNYRYKAGETDPYTVTASKRYQYHLEQIGAFKAWDLLKNTKKHITKVAVLDSGADKEHEDLKNVISVIKSTKDGRVISGSAEDLIGHGTHVAGIIGAEYGNGKGGSGVASGYNNDLIRLMVYGVGSDDGYMYSYDVINGISEAVKDGAKVINMSFAGEVRDRLLEAVIKRAHYDNRVTFVCASGNESSDGYIHPSDMSEVISVCGCDSKGFKNNSTNYGTAKDITAPGTSVVSTIPGDLYAKYSGTSMAAPVVSGTCAMVLDAAPDLTPAQVRNVVAGTAANRPDGASGDYYISNGLGYGRVDAAAAVSAAAMPRTSRVDSISIKKDRKDPIIKIYRESPDDGIYEGSDSKYKASGTGLEVLLSPAVSSAKITWSSDDPEVAAVDEFGYVRGLTPGRSTVIRARAGGKEDSVRVQVLQGSDPETLSFDIRDNDKTLYVGETSARLANGLVIEPANVTNGELYWSSSNMSVAAVNDYGEVTAKAPGKATIRVMSYNGKKAECEVTVKQPPASITINEKNDWLTVGQKYRYSAAVKDKNGERLPGEKILWSSGNEDLAQVSADGTVRAKKDGAFYVQAAVKWDSESEESGMVTGQQKITITKKNYKGKDYSLKKKKIRKKSVVLKWKQIPRVTGYELKRAKSKKGKYKTIRTLKAGKTQFRDKSLKKGRTYYYKVRAKYTKDGKRRKYGYSNIVKVRTKGKSAGSGSKAAKNRTIKSGSANNRSSGISLAYRSSGNFKVTKIRGRRALTVSPGSKPAAAALSDTRSERLEEKKGIVREYAESVYDEYVSDPSLYSSEVWNEIENAYNSALSKIENAKQTRDLYTTDGFFLYISDEISDDLETMSALSTQIKHYIKGSSDVKKLVRAQKKELKELRKQTKKKYFNDFYWGRLQNLFTHSLKELDKVNSVRDYLKAKENVDSWFGEVQMLIFQTTFGTAQNADGEEDEEPYDYSDEEILIPLSSDEEEFIIIIFDDEMSDYILTKKDVEKERKYQTEKLNAYIEKRLVQAKYKGDTKKLKKEVSSFRKKVLNKLEDKESIEKAVNEKLQQLMSETGVGCPAVTRRDFIAAARTYNAKTSDYSRQDYSELKWMDVQNCFFAAKSAIEQAEYQFELYSALDELDKSVKKIMPAKKEFAKVKKQAKKKLRSYTNKKGRRKYVQKKVRKVVKKGLRALDKVEKYEVSELENVAAAYEEKAEKCIKKFRITVKKTGRGKTGRSKKVKYGDTYRLKLSPDAGERIISVTVDGRSRKLKNAYTFRKVKKKHSIVVRFSN